MTEVTVKFKKLASVAQVPAYKSELAAGFDFFAVITKEDSEHYEKQGGYMVDGESVSISPNCRAIIKTGLAVELPPGFEMQIRPRSGLAAKHALTVTNSPGTIDADYRGEILVMLINHGSSPVVIRHGDRIAQGVVCELPRVTIVEVGDLGETKRGTGGLGSTGV